MRQLLITSLLGLCVTLAAQPVDAFQFEDGGQAYDLAGWMELHNTPGLSFYLEYGEGEIISWQIGDHAGEGDFGPETVFPMGAMSGAPVAMLTLMLVEEGQVDLDRPANDYLNRWQIPGRHADEATVRDLLLAKKRWGSEYKPAGYEPAAELPSLLDILRGEAPSLPRGIRFRGNRRFDGNNEYGNWLILQLLVEDQYGAPLAEVAQRELFAPLGMTNSFYAAELSEEQRAQAARGHEEDGSQLADYYRYPEQGAAGLWSTPADYAKLVRHVQNAAAGEDNRLIGTELAEQGLQPIYGFRSLIFHINQYGDPYWGGNCRGFYASFNCSLKYGWLGVATSNRDLNWRVVNFAIGQTHDWVMAETGADQTDN